MLIVEGAYRQGKTRMLEELLFVTDSSIPMISFGLTYADYDVSIYIYIYSAILRDNYCSISK